MDSIHGERQQRISEALGAAHRELREMYLTALALMQEGSESLPPRVRVAFVCHAMREVMARAVGLLAKTASPSITPSISKQIEALPALAAQHRDMDLDASSDRVLIPKEVAAALSKLISSAVQDEHRNRDGVASMLTDDGDRNNFAVDRWVKASIFFTSWAHLHAKIEMEEQWPSDADILRHVQVFEELMDGLATAFFDRRRSVQGLLDEINGTDEGGSNA